jgi:YD repeat-containing protein
MTATTVPAFGTPPEPARTVNHTYSVGGNPLVSSVSDAAGTITTTVDLLGRIVSYTDVWNKTTTFTFDRAGRLTDSAGPAGAQHFDYDAASRLTAQKLDGLTVAVPTYDGAGELASVSYPSGAGNGGNATSGNVYKDTMLRPNGVNWWQTSGLLASDSLVLSRAGRIIDQYIDWVDPYTAGDNFVYDGAGRLIAARAPGHSYTYGYAATGGCGYQTTAGKNTNRTSFTDNGGPATTYCYDAADRLTSSSGPTAVGSPT